jgi:uncharacterized protein (DUF433 family)
MRRSTAIRPLPARDTRLLDPLFTLREAAGYLGIPVATLHTWARGYDWRRPDGTRARGRPLVHALPPDGTNPSLPFIGLAEAYVLDAFRTARVPMQRIRPALARIAEEVGVDYALASRRLYTDGCEVLYDFARHQGEDVLRSLTVVRSGQNVFPEIIAQYLQRIDWDADSWPRALQLPGFITATVIVDVGRAYGRPLLVHGGARLEDIVGRFQGGDSLDDIAVDFGVPRQECEDVIRVAFRQRRAA